MKTSYYVKVAAVSVHKVWVDAESPKDAMARAPGVLQSLTNDPDSIYVALGDPEQFLSLLALWDAEDLVTAEKIEP